MKTFCFKFPNKAAAHSLLYNNVDGELLPRYADIADHGKTGLCVKAVVGEFGTYFTWPDDGSYCADIAGLDEVPAELEPFVIPTPSDAVRKHKFSGE
jgi:hypothetical protein